MDLIAPFLIEDQRPVEEIVFEESGTIRARTAKDSLSSKTISSTGRCYA